MQVNTCELMYTTMDAVNIIVAFAYQVLHDHKNLNSPVVEHSSSFHVFSFFEKTEIKILYEVKCDLNNCSRD